MTRIQTTAQALIQEKLGYVTKELEIQLNTWNTDIDEYDLHIRTLLRSDLSFRI